MSYKKALIARTLCSRPLQILFHSLEVITLGIISKGISLSSPSEEPYTLNVIPVSLNKSFASLRLALSEGRPSLSNHALIFLYGRRIEVPSAHISSNAVLTCISVVML